MITAREMTGKAAKNRERTWALIAMLITIIKFNIVTSVGVLGTWPAALRNAPKVNVHVLLQSKER